jgi:hypothetical protein
MSKIKDLSWDIEQLYIEGFNARTIAVMLECPIEIVYGWIEGNCVADEPQEELSPYATINS